MLQVYPKPWPEYIQAGVTAVPAGPNQGSLTNQIAIPEQSSQHGCEVYPISLARLGYPIPEMDVEGKTTDFFTQIELLVQLALSSPGN